MAGVTVLKSYRQSSKHGPVWRVNAEVVRARQSHVESRVVRMDGH